MSVIGVDVGTTGCKTIVYSTGGVPLSRSYVEYDIQRSAEGQAELDSAAVRDCVFRSIRESMAELAVTGAGAGGPGATSGADAPSAIAVTSMGEATVPVDSGGRILGPSLLNVDTRGNEYVADLRAALPDRELFVRNGNTWGEQFGCTKLMWLRDHQPKIYDRTRWFLHWAPFISVELGAEPFVDYSLANRSLLFDIRTRQWSSELVALCGLDAEKLPPPVAAGEVVGTVSRRAADATGLPEGLPIVSGVHDQCANAVGCGAVVSGSAMYGLGTFPTLCPVYGTPGEAATMIELGLNVEHHALPDLFVSFIFHMGGSIVKWYRDTFAGAEHAGGGDIYPDLFAELDERPGDALLLPYLVPMGPPDFISDLSGVFLGLDITTQRSGMLKAIVEANAFALLRTIRRLPEVGVTVDRVRVVGGGSRSDIVAQINADIFGIPLERPHNTEAGTLGAAILAAVGTGLYPSITDAAQRLVTVERTFHPDEARHRRYRELFEYSQEARELMQDFLRRFRRFQALR